jgi:Uma2 family endonuclease
MEMVMALISYPSIPQTDPPRSPRETLPTMYDLPSEDPEEPGLPDEFHDIQPQLLSRTLRLAAYDRSNFFTASDLNLYYAVKQPLWHKRPDWFLVVDVPRLYEETDLRRSYVIWQEGKYPNVVVEFLSPGTEREDLGRFYKQPSPLAEDQGNGIDAIPLGAPEITSRDAQPTERNKPPSKFEVYEQHLRVPHYIVYSRYSQQLRYFKLEGGRYQEQALAAQPPCLWLADLEIGLGIWAGEFDGVQGHWLRWCDRAGNWRLTDTEQERLEKEQAQLEKEQARSEKEQARLEKEQAQLEKEQARLEKEQAQAQLSQAARNLVATGMEMNQVAELLGLSVLQVQTFCEDTSRP